MAQPENGLGSLCVIGNNVQNLTSIIKDAAPLIFASLLRALGVLCFPWMWEVSGGHIDLQGNNCVGMHFCSFSLCLWYKHLQLYRRHCW